MLYAIENGGFSGAYMPQNIVVGKQAREVAMFVARYAGRQAPPSPGVKPCDAKPIGTLPPSKAPSVLAVRSLSAARVALVCETHARYQADQKRP